MKTVKSIRSTWAGKHIDESRGKSESEWRIQHSSHGFGESWGFTFGRRDRNWFSHLFCRIDHYPAGFFFSTTPINVSIYKEPAERLLSKLLPLDKADVSLINWDLKTARQLFANTVTVSVIWWTVNSITNTQHACTVLGKTRIVCLPTVTCCDLLMFVCSVWSSECVCPFICDCVFTVSCADEWFEVLGSRFVTV